MLNKYLINLLTTIILASLTGSLFACVVDVHPIIIAAFLTVLGLIPLPKGILMFNFSNLEWNDGEENMGGIQPVGYYALIADIDIFPSLPNDQSTASDEVTLESLIGFKMHPDKHFNIIYSTREFNEIIDDNQGKIDGQSFVHKANIIYPGSNHEALAFAKNINNSSMVFVFLETNGQHRVIGSRAFPAKCKPSFTTGKATADRKGMAMEIFSYGYTPAPIYNGVIALYDSFFYIDKNLVIYTDDDMDIYTDEHYV